MRETFIVPLLHPYATSPIASPTLVDYDEYPRYDSPIDSIDHLPIASRFLSPVSFRSDTPNTLASRRDRDGKETPNIDTESTISDDDDDQVARAYSGDSRRHPPSSALAKHNHPRSPYGASQRSGKNPTVPFPSRSHHSLPPPARQNPGASTTSLGRQSYVGPSAGEPSNGESRDGKATPTPSGRGLLRKSKRSLTSSGIIPNGGVAPHQLPDDLRICLEAVEARILEGHLKLSDGLRKRYEEQYPLVRSLADVFVANVCIVFKCGGTKLTHISVAYSTWIRRLRPPSRTRARSGPRGPHCRRQLETHKVHFQIQETRRGRMGQSLCRPPPSRTRRERQGRNGTRHIPLQTIPTSPQIPLAVPELAVPYRSQHVRV